MIVESYWKVLFRDVIGLNLFFGKLFVGGSVENILEGCLS